MKPQAARGRRPEDRAEHLPVVLLRGAAKASPHAAETRERDKARQVNVVRAALGHQGVVALPAKAGLLRLRIKHCAT